MNLGGTRWNNKYICDKCKKEIPFIHRKGFKENLYHHYVSTPNRTAHKDFDLCGSCEKKFKEWLNTREIPTTKDIINRFPIYEEKE